MEDINELIYQSIQQVIVSIDKLRLLLLADNQHFMANDLEAIKLNNESKSVLLKTLSSQTNQLYNRIPLAQNGSHQSLTDYIKQLDHHQGKRIQDIIAELHDQLTDGYQKLIVNNRIVTTNIGMINTVWEKLLQFSKQNTDVYEKPELK